LPPGRFDIGLSVFRLQDLDFSALIQDLSRVMVGEPAVKRNTLRQSAFDVLELFAPYSE